VALIGAPLIQQQHNRQHAFIAIATGIRLSLNLGELYKC